MTGTVMRKRAYIVCIALLVLAALCLWIHHGNSALEANEYTIHSENIPDSFDGYRIAHISDLHNAQMGRENQRLLDMLKGQQPDMIAITGDLIDSRRTDVDLALAFAGEAMKIAPCFYVTGNHESRVSEYETLKAGLESLGVAVLDNDRATIEKSGAQIVILGVRDPAFYEGSWRRHAASIIQTETDSLMQEGDGFTVLLSHRAELFDAYVNSGVDLALCGHAHGGQIRLPIVGGLMAPNQGFFPEYEGGVYTRGQTSMIVSRGIGNSIFPIRINNRPEVVLIRLKKA